MLDPRSHSPARLASRIRAEIERNMNRARDPRARILAKFVGKAFLAASAVSGPAVMDLREPA